MGGMTDQDFLAVHVLAPGDADDQELQVLSGRLRGELLGLDVDAVESVPADAAPADAKGAVAALGGWLAVRLGPAALRTVINSVVAWAGRNDRSVEISFGEHDVLKLTGISSEQQDEVIHEWIARNAGRA